MPIQHQAPADRTLLDRALDDLDAERAARRREQALVRSGQALSSTLELGEILGVVLRELHHVVPFDSASVQELRDDKMVIVAAEGIELSVFAGVAFDATGARRPNGVVAEQRVPVIVDDILGDHPFPDFPIPRHRTSGSRSWMGVPLLFGGDCIGMLTLDADEPGFYTEEHARLALAFASQAAIALENARAYARIRHEVEERRRAEEDLRTANAALRERMAEIESLQEVLREQAFRDHLTGLHNRRFLMDTLERDVARCRRDGLPLSIAMVDVDHFKAVNDTLGHESGDHLLVAVAEYLSSQVRDGDAVCRYGGEEFVVVLPNTTLEVATRRAEDWREAVRHLAIGADGRPITISIGVSSLWCHGGSAEALLRTADAAMYEAKAVGRDRVVVATA